MRVKKFLNMVGTWKSIYIENYTFEKFTKEKYPL